MATTNLKSLFESLKITLTSDTIKKIIHWCLAYETRGEHPLALNSPMLGVYRCYFYTSDMDELFHIFNLSRIEFRALALQSKALQAKWKVTSDPMNLLCIYLIHLSMINTKLSQKELLECRTCLGKMMQYRFFTTVVNHNLPHGSNQEVMAALIDSLTAKFDIKQADTPTWKLVIEKRCRDIFDKESSIHYKTLIQFSDDEEIMYALADIETRIRAMLVRVCQAYMAFHAKGARISGTSLVDEIDGEKYVRDITDTYDDLSVEVCNRAINVNRFLNLEYVKFISKLGTAVRMDMFRLLLVKFSEIANAQYKKGQGNLVRGTGPDRLLIGYNVLIHNIVQKTYRHCIMTEHVNMNSKTDILVKTRDIYRSSRIQDDDILVIKNSVEHFVNANSGSTREATNSSLKLAFLCYIILMSFE